MVEYPKFPERAYVPTILNSDVGHEWVMEHCLAVLDMCADNSEIHGMPKALFEAQDMLMLSKAAEEADLDAPEDLKLSLRVALDARVAIIALHEGTPADASAAMLALGMNFLWWMEFESKQRDQSKFTELKRLQQNTAEKTNKIQATDKAARGPIIRERYIQIRISEPSMTHSKACKAVALAYTERGYSESNIKKVLGNAATGDQLVRDYLENR